jgi:hypothetical protein
MPLRTGIIISRITRSGMMEFAVSIALVLLLTEKAVYPFFLMILSSKAVVSISSSTIKILDM